MVPKTLVKKLKLYRKALEKQGIPVSKLILYGSRARGDHHRESDIDVCVISPKLGRRVIREGVFISTIAHQIDPLIEATLFSLKDWQTKQTSPLLHEIRKHGILF